MLETVKSDDKRGFEWSYVFLHFLITRDWLVASFSTFPTRFSIEVWRCFPQVDILSYWQNWAVEMTLSKAYWNSEIQNKNATLSRLKFNQLQWFLRSMRKFMHEQIPFNFRLFSLINCECEMPVIHTQSHEILEKLKKCFNQNAKLF